MNGLTRQSWNLGLGALRAYTLAAFGLVSMSLFINLSDEQAYGPWLIWCLAGGLAAAMAGSLGAELRLVAGARLYRILPASRTRLALSSAILLVLALVPVISITLLQAAPIWLAGLAIALALAFLSAGLWLGINGPMYLALAMMLPAMLAGGGIVDLASSPIIVAASLLLAGGLALCSWHRFFGSNTQPNTSRSFRGWIWHQPEQAIGWRMLCVHAGLTLLFIVIITLPYADPLVSLPAEPSAMAHLLIGIAFATTLMIALCALNESVLYRQRMRQLLMLPGRDRGRLYAALETGLVRLVLTLGLVPAAVVMIIAGFTDQLVPIMWLLAALIVGNQLLVGWGALVLAASRDGSIAFVAILAGIVGSFVLLVLLNLIVEAEAWPTWAWLWLITSMSAAAGLRYLARRRWLRLSLESIDHWLVVRLAHQQWRSDL